MTLGNHNGESVYICYESSDTLGGPFNSAIACAAADTGVTTIASGNGLECTPPSTASTISLDYADISQTNIRVRVCESATDDLQDANSNVVLAPCTYSISLCERSHLLWFQVSFALEIALVFLLY